MLVVRPARGVDSARAAWALDVLAARRVVAARPRPQRDLCRAWRRACSGWYLENRFPRRPPGVTPRFLLPRPSRGSSEGNA